MDKAKRAGAVRQEGVENHDGHSSGNTQIGEGADRAGTGGARAGRTDMGWSELGDGLMDRGADASHGGAGGMYSSQSDTVDSMGGFQGRPASSASHGGASNGP